MADELIKVPDIGGAEGAEVVEVLVSPGEAIDVDVRCNSHTTNDRDKEDGERRFTTLLLGPYFHPTRGLRVKCIDLETTFQYPDVPANAAAVFESLRDDHVLPTATMLQTASAQLLRQPLTAAQRTAATSMGTWASTLRRRLDVLRQVQTRCARDAGFARVARQLVRNLFYAVWYFRRWAGPGTAYPTSSAMSRSRVGGQNKPISNDLAGRYVRTTPKGEVRLFDGWDRDRDLHADLVIEGALTSMQTQYFLAVRKTVDACEDNTARSLLERLPVAIDNCKTVEGGYWPGDETLWQYCFTGDAAIALGMALRRDERNCIRARSRQLVNTVDMLIGIVYKSRPEWSRYEGEVDYVQ